MAADGRLTLALLLEVEVEGRPSRLELAGPDGLLTLHPSVDGRRLHGNVVRARGVDHVDLPWSTDHLLLVGGSLITAAVAASWLQARVGVGQGDTSPVVEVGPDLRVRSATWRVARVGERRWRLVAADRTGGLAVDLDPAGVPVGMPESHAWPLELDPPAG